MTTATLDRGRITARVPAGVQQTLETAASMVGATVNQFVVQSALREAERIIEQEQFARRTDSPSPQPYSPPSQASAGR